MANNQHNLTALQRAHDGAPEILRTAIRNHPSGADIVASLHAVRDELREAFRAQLLTLKSLCPTIPRNRKIVADDGAIDDSTNARTLLKQANLLPERMNSGTLHEAAREIQKRYVLFRKVIRLAMNKITKPEDNEDIVFGEGVSEE